MGKSSGLLRGTSAGFEVMILWSRDLHSKWDMYRNTNFHF